MHHRHLGEGEPPRAPSSEFLSGERAENLHFYQMLPVWDLT